MSAANLADEVWLARKLGAPALFAGATTGEQRRERVRSLILDKGMAGEVVGKRNGKPETFGALFGRLYGVPLGISDGCVESK